MPPLPCTRVPWYERTETLGQGWLESWRGGAGLGTGEQRSGKPHLSSHQAGATGHVQDQGSSRRALKGLGEVVHSQPGGTVLEGGHVLGTEG